MPAYNLAIVGVAPQNFATRCARR